MISNTPNTLSPELKAQIEEDAKVYTDKIQPETGSKNTVRLRDYQLRAYNKAAYIAGATDWAIWKVRYDEERKERVHLDKENDILKAKLQQEEEMMGKMAKAVRLIEQMSDPGDCYLAIYRMKSIASDLLTEYNNYKQTKDDTANG